MNSILVLFLQMVCVNVAYIVVLCYFFNVFVVFIVNSRVNHMLHMFSCQTFTFGRDYEIKKSPDVPMGHEFNDVLGEMRNILQIC